MMTNDLKIGLLGALSIHVALFLCLAVWSTRSDFNITVSPSSLEVALVPFRPMKKEEVKKIIPSQPFIKKKTIEDVVKVKEAYSSKVMKEDLIVKKQELSKEFMASEPNLITGALTEARPNPVFNKPPAYPRLAREQGYEGRLLLKVFITKEGLVAKTKVIYSSGHQILDRSASNAVTKWRFQPAQRFGVSVGSVLEIPFVFRLDDV